MALTVEEKRQEIFSLIEETHEAEHARRLIAVWAQESEEKVNQVHHLITEAKRSIAELFQE